MTVKEKCSSSLEITLLHICLSALIIYFLILAVTTYQLPDTRIMRVEYYVDDWGFHPTITYEGVAQFPPSPPATQRPPGGFIPSPSPPGGFQPAPRPTQRPTQGPSFTQRPTQPPTLYGVPAG